MKLWYRSATTDWKEGLPIGTGRLAAMVLGEAGSERLALNHEWLWRGNGRNREPDKSAHLLAGVRELILAGKYEEGNIAGNDAFGGGGGARKKEKPNRVDPYQPAGDFLAVLNHGAATDYRRELDRSRRREDHVPGRWHLFPARVYRPHRTRPAACAGLRGQAFRGRVPAEPR